MNKERLQMMVDLLRNLPERAKGGEFKYFDLTSWSQDASISPTHATLRGNATRGCGTAACAIGFAAEDKKFNDLGFGRSHGLAPAYDRRVDWTAVGHFFELDHPEALKLFSSHAYDQTRITPEQVAKRIERFIETGEIN